MYNVNVLSLLQAVIILKECYSFVPMCLTTTCLASQKCFARQSDKHSRHALRIERFELSHRVHRLIDKVRYMGWDEIFLCEI